MLTCFTKSTVACLFFTTPQGICLCAFELRALHCSFPNCHHFSEQRKCFALNRKSRSGTGTHLSEQCSRPPGCSRAEVALHCNLPNCHHFSEQRKCFALNRKWRSGTGTHLSEQRRCCSAHGRRAGHVPKLPYTVASRTAITFLSRESVSH
jgi:hypothetical protein